MGFFNANKERPRKMRAIRPVNGRPSPSIPRTARWQEQDGRFERRAPDCRYIFEVVSKDECARERRALAKCLRREIANRRSGILDLYARLLLCELCKMEESVARQCAELEEKEAFKL